LGRKERYVLAMALLLVVGLATAWAGYSATTTIPSSISEFLPSVSGESGIALSGLKKGVWFYKGETRVFTITVPSNATGEINVTVGVANMGQIASTFDALEINVTLKDGSNNLVDQGVISLGGGISTVVLGASVSGGASGTTYYVVVTISGRPAKSGSVNIIMYCSVRPAEAVEVE
jgi:hypothetical protein